MLAAAKPASEPAHLTLETIVPYLLENQLVSARDVVEGNFTIQDRSRRNRNFAARTGEEGRGLLVKQAGSFHDAHAVATVRIEAALTRSLAEEAAFEDVRDAAPEFVHYDRERHVLVTALIEPATSMTKFHQNLGKPVFPADSADAAASVLARFHDAASDAARAGLMPFLGHDIPFAWKIGEWCSGPRTRDAAINEREYATLVRGMRFWKRVPAMQARWLKQDGVVHGDPRWDNLLLTAGEGAHGGLNVRLIDWEFAGRGDPTWDATFYLAEHLRFWLWSARGKPGRGLEDVEKRATFKLPRAHAGARRFWRSYARARRWSPAARARAFARLREFLPFHLALFGYEGVHGSRDLPAPCRAAAEMAVLADEDPDRCLERWLGIVAEEAS